MLLVGIVCGLILSQLISLLIWSMGTEKTIACFDPSKTQTKYCVYHTSKPGLFGNENKLVIGIRADRGLMYTIPYTPQQVSAEIDPDTEAIIITMPHTQLKIDQSEYVDTR